MRNKRFPKYPDDADYTTNSPSYYDDLARKQKLIQLLAEKIWEYENTLNETLEQIEQRLTDYIQQNDLLMNERLENWDQRIDEMPEEMRSLFVTWLNDGTLEQIINHDVLGGKADKSDEKPIDPIYSKQVFTRNDPINYRIPVVIKSKTGRLISAIDERYQWKDLGADIRIVSKYSDDDGLNWSERNIVLDFGRSADSGVSDPSIVQHELTGRIFVFGLFWGDTTTAVANRDPDNPAYNFYYAYSDDDGENWSEPVSIKHLKDPKWHILFQSPSPGYYHDGVVYIPAQYWDEHHKSHSTYITSADNGANWEVFKQGIPSETTESNITISPSGRIIMNARGITTRTIAKKATPFAWIDIDQGIADAVSQGSVIKGEDFYYMSHQNTMGYGNTRERLCISYSKDSEKWEMLAVIDDVRSQGYSSVVDLGENLGVLYEDGQNTGSIVFRVYKKTDLFSAKHRMMYNIPRERHVEVRDNTIDSLYLPSQINTVYLSGNYQKEIDKIYGWHGQEITIKNITNKPIKIKCLGFEHHGGIDNKSQNHLFLSANGGVDLVNFDNKWYVKNKNSLPITDLGRNFTTENTLIEDYPVGVSYTNLFVSGEEWTLGLGIVKTFRYTANITSNVFNYQLFTRPNNDVNFKQYRRNVLTDGSWGEWFELNQTV